MTDHADTLSTENVVASGALSQEVDLAALSEDLERTSFDPEQFPGLVYRAEDAEAVALIFRSGKIVWTGAPSLPAMENAVDLTFDSLQELGLEVPSDSEVTIQNIVTSGDLGQGLNLNAIAIGLGLEIIEYEPEQFPGLVYRPPDLDTVTLLFGSGRFIITGGNQPADAVHTIEYVSGQLAELDLLE